MFEPRRNPYRAVRRHQPAPLRRGELHRPLGGINQLRLAVHVGVEPPALAVMTRDQVDAVAGGAVAPSDGSDWRFGDTHWPHPVRIRTYNLSQETTGIAHEQLHPGDRFR